MAKPGTVSDNVEATIHWVAEMWIVMNLEFFEFHKTPLEEVIQASNREGREALETSESLFWDCVDLRRNELRRFLEER